MRFSKWIFIPALAALAIVSSASASWAKQEPGRHEAAKESPKKPVTVTSDTMEAIANENVVVFKGNVVAVEDFTLCSDELLVRYGKDKDVSEIEASGNVRIFQEDKTSTSDRAVYDRADRTLVLTGRPQVKQCTDTVKGDRITVYLDRDNALVEGEKGGRVKAVIMPEKKCPETLKEASKDASAEKRNSEEARCKGSR